MAIVIPNEQNQGNAYSGAPLGGSLRPLWIAALVSVLSGLLLGFDNLVISGTLDYMAKDFQLDAWGIGFAASVAQIGGLLGALMGGWIGDKAGCKRGINLCTALFFISSVGIFFSHSLYDYTVWRVICGFGSGMATIIAPQYIAEMSPSRFRGRLVTLYQVGLVFGIFAAILMNRTIHGMGDEAWNIESGWRWMFFVGIIPSLFLFAAVVPALESPRWLYKVGKGSQGFLNLEKIEGTVVAQKIQEEIQNQKDEPAGLWKDLLSRDLRQPLLIGVMLVFFSQASGINVVLVYMPEIFKSMGVEAAEAFTQSVWVSLVNMFFSLMALLIVDRFGRKFLILIGTVIQIVSLFSIAYAFHGAQGGGMMLLLLMGCVAGHAIGNGVACWVIVSEIFPSYIRGKAISVSIAMMWVASYAVLQGYPVIKSYGGEALAFTIFGVFALLNLIFVLIKVPETKGYTLEEISKLWRKG